MIDTKTGGSLLDFEKVYKVSGQKPEARAKSLEEVIKEAEKEISLIFERQQGRVQAAVK